MTTTRSRPELFNFFIDFRYGFNYNYNIHPPAHVDTYGGRNIRIICLRIIEIRFISRAKKYVYIDKINNYSCSI